MTGDGGGKLNKMKNPCKECIVDPICGIECPSFQAYINEEIKRIGFCIKPPFNTSGCLRFRRTLDDCQSIGLWLSAKKLRTNENINVVVCTNDNGGISIKERMAKPRPCIECKHDYRCKEKDMEFVRNPNRYEDNNE